MKSNNLICFNKFSVDLWTSFIVAIRNSVTGTGLYVNDYSWRGPAGQHHHHDC